MDNNDDQSSTSSESSSDNNDIGEVNPVNQPAPAPPRESVFHYPRRRGIRPQSRTPSSGEEVPRVTFDIVDQIDLRIRNRQEGRLEVW